MTSDKVDQEQSSCQIMRGITTGRCTLFVERIDGDGAAGGLITLDIAARLSSGRTMLDGSLGPAGDVIVVGTHDVEEEQLQTMGADLARVEIVRASEGFRVPDGIENLRALAGQLRPRLVLLPDLNCAASPGLDLARFEDLELVVQSLNLVAECGPAVVAVAVIEGEMTSNAAPAAEGM